MSKESKYKNEQADFYMENGLLVFTEAYHLKRGYCCKCGCRHCPYRQKKTKEEDTKSHYPDDRT